MILNTYALIDALLCGCRLTLGILVVWAAVRTYRRIGVRGAEEHEVIDRRYTLLLLSSAALGVLSLASWPVFYLLLQSYVHEWPGLRCIYGVTRIGEGSIGSSRLLPPLVSALEWTKPSLAFLCGVWLVLHILNQSGRTGSLTNRLVLVMAATAFVAELDVAAELAYLAIPKKEVFPSAGCCASVHQPIYGTDRFGQQPLVSGDQRLLLSTHYATSGLLLVGVWALTPRLRWPNPVWRMAGLLVFAAAAAAVEIVFIVDVLAPRLMGDPDHHCPYDLITAAPVSVLALGLFVVGSFSVGWACAAYWLGGGSLTHPVESGVVGGLCRIALISYAASFVMHWTELALV